MARIPRPAAVTLALVMALALMVRIPGAAAQSGGKEWIQKSNAHAMLVLDSYARFNPEAAGSFGMAGYDDKILDLTPGMFDRVLASTNASLAELEKRLAAEQDPRVRQDLDIMIDRLKEALEGQELSEKLQQPYFDVSSTVYQGLKALLDDQVPAERRAAALVRLRKYAGDEPGHQPITQLAIDRTRERTKPGLLPPVKSEVERNLQTSPTYIKGIAALFEKYKLGGWKKSYDKLAKQLTAYDDFVRKEILPTARTDFRQPAELYQFSLKQYGNTMPVPEMVSRAQVAFKELQNQMQALAPFVAKEHGWKLTDYRDVIRELKKKQIVGEAILPHYQARLAEIEGIIQREKILTLPARKAKIQLADAAETAAIPAPHMKPPRLIGNTGELGVFMLPLRIPGADGKLVGFDDFTFEAASWTLTAHEARPGHELQFAKMVENGVSLARGLFAQNSVNTEGWGLYSEAELAPYEPLEGQLIALQHRLMRATRAILDPGLQAGTITKEEAMRVLQEDVVLSEAMATQETQRYMFLAPGQATSYFVGYSRLLEIRSEAERVLGKQFDRQKFNDFILAQGLLPTDLLKKAVVEEFLPQQISTR